MDNLSGFQVSDLGALCNTKLMLKVDLNAQELNAWLEENVTHLQRLLAQNGALLLRSMPIQGSKKLERVLSTIFDNDLIEYGFRSTPRTKMRGRIYTSSEYHASEVIGLHNENAYSNSWAMNIAFYCVKSAEQGGQTPIADSRKVYQSIPETIRKTFESRQLLYVRNYGDIDLPWSEVFQTDNREEVEAYCEQNKIEFEWRGKNGLQTRQIANAAYRHPITNEPLWFNQAHMFHISALPQETRHSLLDTFSKDALPRNVYYADGEDIEDAALDQIRAAYLENKLIFDWHENDLLLMDNMLYAHGREPFDGARRVLVGMANPMQAEHSALI